MHLPVAVWSHCALRDLSLRVTTTCVARSDESAATALVCGTATGVLLLFRATAGTTTWRLAALLLRHKAPIAGLVIGTNEWGQAICASVDVNGAIGLWQLSDGRCLAWLQAAATDIAPVLGMQIVSNDRYMLVYGEQGRMVLLDAWKAIVLASPGTSMHQARIDVAVAPCRKTSHMAYDAVLLSLGMEGLVSCFGWTQPIVTSSSASDPCPTFVWTQAASWVISWSSEASDITCIETSIHPATNWLHVDLFPLHARLSPNGRLVLFVWSNRWAILQRAWLFHSIEDETTMLPHCIQATDDVEWVDGTFADDEHVLLWTVDNRVYSFPAVDSLATDADGSTTTFLYLFTAPATDAEKPTSTARPLRTAKLPDVPLCAVPACACRRPPFATSFGTIACTPNAGITYVCPSGCTWRSSATTSAPTPLSTPTPSPPRVSHMVMGKKPAPGASAPASLLWNTPLLIHGYDDGHISLCPLVGAPHITLDCLSSAITSIGHVIVNAVESTPHAAAAPLYEGYADSPTSSVRYPSTEKLQRISLLLHKLQHSHLSTPKAALLSPPRSSPPSAETLSETPMVVLLFTGSRDGSVGVSQIRLRVDAGVVVPSATLLHSFHRHRKAVRAIHVSGPSPLGHLVACVGDDHAVSVYTVRMDTTALDVGFFMDCVGQGGCVVDVRWDFRTQHVLLECDDALLYIWSLRTGVLERIVPSAMVPASAPAEEARDPVTIASPLSAPMVHVMTFELRATVERLQRLWASPSASSTGTALDATFLSFALSWGLDARIDALVERYLYVHAPSLAYSMAITGAAKALTVPLPSPSAPHTTKWQQSSFVSAEIALALVTMCTSFMDDERKDDELSEQLQVLWSQLITQHMVCLPEQVDAYVEPSLDVLASYGFHEWEALQMASRLLLHGVIKRLPPTTRSTTAAEYMTRYHCEVQQLEKDLGSLKQVPAPRIVSRLGSMLVLLSVMGTCFPGELSPASARQVCDVLVSLLQGPAATACVAAELLAKGLLLFRPHLVDLAQLVVQLIPLTLDPSNDERKRLKQAAMRLLVELGTCEAASVLLVLQQEMSTSDRSYAYREGVLVYLMTWVNLQHLLMARHLPAVIETILCCLDPTKPDRRKKCLAMSTKCLHDLVKRFPMVDFHKTTQRLAIGTMEGVVLLYDLRTATKWRVLDGHTTALSAVLFRKDGAMLVSYAAREASVRWWNVTAGGLLSLLKVQQSCVRQLQLAPLTQHLQRPAELHKVIQSCRFRLAPDDVNVWLTREDESLLPLNFHI
ncbi:hypothetical protein SDRG_11976 [Saprolegnia diclina VS20]|uniref:Uncharacterized protein n=1 Tax=Saprolegnia diclina (strain VS20) TaxID=1156394 RepID=T0Q724_SAPDV|nr:hypothetical protein SDRG_11976 [Saprolegnia diclina VS20]EQC30401.1 hypothetical protein SDRG_11976 [Saprolegnia diclina VS20]|eukprot:XP_008616254.1 hypothetical protein SDRG_11976 [Saprolegnia diclina VS20]